MGLVQNSDHYDTEHPYIQDFNVLHPEEWAEHYNEDSEAPEGYKGLWPPTCAGDLLKKPSVDLPCVYGCSGRCDHDCIK